MVAGTLQANDWVLPDKPDTTEVEKSEPFAAKDRSCDTTPTLSVEVHEMVTFGFFLRLILEVEGVTPDTAGAVESVAVLVIVNIPERP